MEITPTKPRGFYGTSGKFGMRMEIDLLRRIYLYRGNDYINKQLVITYFYACTFHDDTLIRKHEERNQTIHRNRVPLFVT